jgi:sortase A
VLWGTGLATSRAQRALRQQVVPNLETRPPQAGPTASGAFHLGDGVGVIVIPRIHLDMVVVQGVDLGTLTRGPGHYPETPYPWEQHGRVGIAGHRTTYLHPFWSLDKLRSGDLIRLRTEFGRFDYHVTEVRTVSPNDLSVLRQTVQPSLVLTTCNPRFSATQRLVVIAYRT